MPDLRDPEKEWKCPLCGCPREADEDDWCRHCEMSAEPVEDTTHDELNEALKYLQMALFGQGVPPRKTAALLTKHGMRTKP